MEQVKAAVLDELKLDSRVNVDNITVTVEDDGAVVLTGTVPSFAARHAAEDAAWRVLGVSFVENDLDVKYQDHLELPSDEELQERIEKVLSWDPEMTAEDIAVQVVAGRVILKGSVDAYWKLLRAERIATSVIGVMGVDNYLSVVPTHDFVDEEIADDIVSAFERNLYIDPESVHVTVANGVVTLEGSVPDFVAWRAAYDAAAATHGVLDIVDNLNISSEYGED